MTREGSFSGAASKLGRSTAAVSRQVRALEEQIGTRLLERTTRTVHVTDAGRTFADRAGAALADLEAAREAVSGLAEHARGTLRVNAPTTFGERHLAPLLPAFLEAYPELRLVLTLTDRFVDVIEEGYDVVVRITDLVGSTLVARRLAPCRRVLCGSPGYLEKRGVPRTPSDLDDHDCIGYSIATTWRFRGGARRVAGVHRVSLETNNGEVMRQVAIAGRGIALLPTFVVGDDLRSGALVPVLERHLDADTTIHALYPERRLLPAKVRAFVDFLATRISSPPPWDDGLEA